MSGACSGATSGAGSGAGSGASSYKQAGRGAVQLHAGAQRPAAHRPGAPAAGGGRHRGVHRVACHAAVHVLYQVLGHIQLALPWSNPVTVLARWPELARWDCRDIVRRLATWV